MHGTLTVPLYIIAEERQVASITRSYDEIIDVLLLRRRLLRAQDWLE
jgi:hypothetical protein